jgi:hypothetical protein
MENLTQQLVIFTFMNKYYKFSLALVALLSTVSICLAETGKSLTIYGRQYYNGQTVYIDCTVTTVLVETDYTPATPSNRPLVKDWTSSANFSLQPTFGTEIDNSGSVYLTFDPNRNNGSLTADFWTNNDRVTVYFTQKPTPSLTITPTLCNSGQSGDFSTTLNFYGSSTANVVWETTGGLTVNGGSSYRVIDNTISRATVQHNSYGTLTVYGEIPGCNNMRTNSVVHHIGTPSSLDFRLNSSPSVNGISICAYQTYYFYPTMHLPESQYNYTWSMPIGGNDFNYNTSGYSSNLSSRSSNGGGVFQITLTNLACNTTVNTSQTLQVTDCNGSFRVASNPSNNVITAIFEPVEDAKYLPNVVRLSHEKNGIVKEVNVREKFLKENKATGLRVDLDVKNLPKDTYYLQGIYDNGTIQSERIIVQ